MTEEKSCLDCKHWDSPACPHRDNESIIKATKGHPGELKNKDIEIEELKKLSIECPKYAPDPPIR